MKATVGGLMDRVNDIDRIIDIMSNGNINELYDTELIEILEEYRGVILNTKADV